ncbi:MAG: hypothetical protein NUV73_04370 [Candidatus Daviesbacteria bacterium]|nr:hypothetical protein [Candidatus Daviesbacteria bacterium]
MSFNRLVETWRLQEIKDASKANKDGGKLIEKGRIDDALDKTRQAEASLNRAIIIEREFLPAVRQLLDTLGLKDPDVSLLHTAATISPDDLESFASHPFPKKIRGLRGLEVNAYRNLRASNATAESPLAKETWMKQTLPTIDDLSEATARFNPVIRALKKKLTKGNIELTMTKIPDSKQPGFYLTRTEPDIPTPEQNP